MEKFTALFDEYVVKAITMTEAILETDYTDPEKLQSFTDNRERLFAVIDQISRQVNWTEVPEELKADLTRKIDYIKKLDEKLLTALQLHQEDARKEIERTHRIKENVRGYNLTDVK
jgi:hypothetical protein